MSQHVRHECKHGTVIYECRCAAPNKTVTIGPCPQWCTQRDGEVTASEARPPMTLGNRYYAAAHRMQSATAFDLTKRLGLDTLMGQHLRPELVNKVIKDVRVGLNSAMSDQGALAELLIKKGVFTDEEYREAVTIWMEREADARCADVCARYNLPPGTTFA